MQFHIWAHAGVTMNAFGLPRRLDGLVRFFPGNSVPATVAGVTLLLSLFAAAQSPVAVVTPGTTMTSVAGTGAPGFGGDSGAAASAQLDTPMGVAVDAAGNIYIADTANQRIREINTSGVITTIAGNGQQGYSGDGGAATS